MRKVLVVGRNLESDNSFVFTYLSTAPGSYDVEPFAVLE
jgi:hypothetical protein